MGSRAKDKRQNHDGNGNGAAKKNGAQHRRLTREISLSRGANPPVWFKNFLYFKHF